MKRKIGVAAAALVDSSKRVLIAERALHENYGGVWEFPGGKIESGESAFQALKREMLEELGIQITKGFSLGQIEHEYENIIVDLEVFVVPFQPQVLHLVDHSAVEWVLFSDLEAEKLAVADRPFVGLIKSFLQQPLDFG